MSPLIRLRSRNSKKTPPVAEPVDTPPNFLVGIAYDTGRVRQSNEDCIISISSLQQGDNAFPYYGLFVVADGMGGHEQGERASLLAAQTFAREVMLRFGTQWLGSEAEDAESIQEVLESSISLANLAVLHELPGSGTTLTAALVFSRQMFLTHIGDSRAYVLNGDIRQITHDHSLVQRLIDQGQISQEEAGRFAQRNVLLKAVGQADTIETDFITAPWEIGSRLLICSDGLWGVLSDAEILHICQAHENPQDAVNALIRQANLMGGPDNISVVIVELHGEK